MMLNLPKRLFFALSLCVLFQSCAEFEDIKPTNLNKEVTVTGRPLTLVDGTHFAPGENRFFTDTASTWIKEGALEVSLYSRNRIVKPLTAPLTDFFYSFDLKVTSWSSGTEIRLGLVSDTATGSSHPFVGLCIKKMSDSLVSFSLVGFQDSSFLKSISFPEFREKWFSYGLWRKGDSLIISENGSDRKIFSTDMVLALTSSVPVNGVVVERTGSMTKLNLDNLFLYQ